MWTVCRWRVVGLLVLSLSAGCRSSSNTGRIQLERSLEGPIGWIVEGNEYHVIASLRDDRQRENLAREVINYLKNDPRYCTEFPPEVEETGGSVLRQRDFWALVLAKLTDWPLHLYPLETFESRDRKINELVVAVTGNGNSASTPLSKGVHEQSAPVTGMGYR